MRNKSDKYYNKKYKNTASAEWSVFIRQRTDRQTESYGGIAMIFIAIVCTLLGGVLGASLEPVSFSISIPIAIMGGFILKAIKDKKD